MPTVACPAHADTLTPAEARVLAVTLIELADQAEGEHITERGMAHWEVVAELAQLREQVARWETRPGLPVGGS